MGRTSQNYTPMSRHWLLPIQSWDRILPIQSWHRCDFSTGHCALCRCFPLDPPSKNLVNVATGIDNAVTNGATVPTLVHPAVCFDWDVFGECADPALRRSRDWRAAGCIPTDKSVSRHHARSVRLGSGGIGRGPALGFAAEREALPEDVTLAYAKAVKAPVYKARAALRSALERVGWRLRRL